MAVIKASELWAAMEPELLITVEAELEPVTETEKQQEEDENNMEEENHRATAVKIAQYLRINKYRYISTSIVMSGEPLKCLNMKNVFSYIVNSIKIDLYFFFCFIGVLFVSV